MFLIHSFGGRQLHDHFYASDLYFFSYRSDFFMAKSYKYVHENMYDNKEVIFRSNLLARLYIFIDELYLGWPFQ